MSVISAKIQNYLTHGHFQRIPLCNRQPVSVNESTYSNPNC